MHTLYRHEPSIKANFVGVSSMLFVVMMGPDAPTVSVIPEAQAEPTMIEVTEFTQAIRESSVNHNRNVNMGRLAHRKVGDLFSDYLGQRRPHNRPATLPSQTKVDFAASLQAMWDRKLRRPVVSGATRSKASTMVSRYVEAQPDIKTADQFVRQIDVSARISHTGIDYSSFCARYRITDFQCQALVTVSSHIRGKHLAAYGMTELFPGRNGAFNYATLDTLLKHGGENYVQSIPAMYDKYLSVGFYQFTSFAVRHDTNVEGASVVSLYSTNKIPGSVMNLSSADHHRAAYFFAVFNMGRLADGLSRENSAKFTRCPIEGVTQFIAAAHHLPSPAIRAAKRWINDDCKSPYASYVNGALRDYALKTSANLAELDKHS